MTTTIDAPATFLAARRPLVIEQPGVYDIEFADYLRDPVPAGSLSKSGAKLLLPPSCPALFRHDQLHRRPPKKEFEIGTAAHTLVLGTGPDLVQIDADAWNTTKVKAEVAEVRERGAIPLKPAEFAMVMSMAAAIRKHPVAAKLLSPEWGEPEQSMFWIDKDTGVWRRSRPDILPHRSTSRVIIPDYKTCLSADDDSVSRAIHDYGYHQQRAQYTDGAIALDRAGEDVDFVLIFQEKQAPHLVRVVRLDTIASNIGRDLNKRALAIYAECKATDTWPGYSSEIDSICVPAWVESNYEWGNS